MGPPKQRLLRLTFGALCAAWACMAFAPVADAQFFWWFDQPKSAPKPRLKPKPPGDDLPPIVPRESSVPPPPDDRPYDNKLLRLAEKFLAPSTTCASCAAHRKGRSGATR